MLTRVIEMTFAWRNHDSHQNVGINKFIICYDIRGIKDFVYLLQWKHYAKHVP